MVNVQNAVRYAIGKSIDEDHPRLETGHCLDIKKQVDPCGLCVDICPTGATLGPRDHNWDACIDCNLCVAVCPTRALRSSAVNIDRFLHAIHADTTELTVACEQYGDAGFLQTYCMGSIPWEVFALCALDKTILLHSRRCAECPEEAGRAQLTQTLRKVRTFLGPEYFDAHFVESAGSTSSGYSRREAFSFLKGIGMNVAENMLVRDKTAPILGSFFQSELEYRLNSPAKTDPIYTLRTPVFNDSCWACNVCRNACPTKALSIEHDEDAKEYYIVHNPLLCCECGTCMKVCKDDAIDGFISFTTTTPTVPLATLASPTVCKECGRNFRPDGGDTCLRCIKAAERKELEAKAAAERKARIDKMKEEQAKKAAEMEAAKKATEMEAARQAAESQDKTE